MSSSFLSSVQHIFSFPVEKKETSSSFYLSYEQARGYKEKKIDEE
jgi:hypothetical protein